MGYYDFPYTIKDNIAIYFGDKEKTNTKDLLIYYQGLFDNDFIQCNCSRWDTDNYNIVIETWLNGDDTKTLRDNIVPGAVGELYTVLGKPFYYDKTWTGRNTLRLVPYPSSLSNLKMMRKPTVIYPKSITTVPIKGEEGWMNVKIEGFISGGQDI